MEHVLCESRLRDLILGREAAFSVGVPGAISEFHWTGDDAVTVDEGGAAIATSLGAVAVRLSGDERLATLAPLPARRAPPHGQDQPAHETGAERVVWLPEALARIAPRRGLAELGPDRDAVQPRHRDDVLFDLGFGLGHVRACVRTSQPALLARLRAHVGDDLLAGAHPAMAALKALGPHRVFLSARARIEVYQPIPSRARGERTPPGPHSHVLPALMGRPDPQRARLPPDACAVLTVHPRLRKTGDR